MKPLRKTNREMLIIAVAALIALLLTAMPALAKVKGACVDCHTMHNSQDGATMSVYADGSGAIPVAEGANDSLLRMGCIACHKSETVAFTTGGEVPFVWQPTVTSTTATGSLAGGNFEFVVNRDACGHNVAGIASVDGATFGKNPPGFKTGITGTSGDARGFLVTGSTTQLTCAGTYGCHGDPDPLLIGDFAAISGAHHGVENLNKFADGSTTGSATLGKSYRFLYGIKGIEDPDWEYTTSNTVGSADHNQYHGDDRGTNTVTDNQTISHLCCECHGNFHAAENVGTDAYGASPFNRHPTDFDMGSSPAEYQAYNNPVGSGTDGAYSTLAPVASDLSGTPTTGDHASINSWVVSIIYGTNDSTTSAIVTCISCHRAHASEFDDLLRWNYNTVDGSGDYVSGTRAGYGDTGSGCFVCHTTKDDI